MNTRNPITLSVLAVAVFMLITCAPPNSEIQSGDSAGQKVDSCLAEQARLAANKEMVTSFYQQLFGDKDLSVIDKYIAEDYIQHNPMAADGREALKEVLSKWFVGAPKDTVDFQRVAADGDLVILHIRSTFGGKTRAIVDIFRIEDGMIAEHWDVIQEVPEESKNPHPMF